VVYDTLNQRRRRRDEDEPAGVDTGPASGPTSPMNQPSAERVDQPTGDHVDVSVDARPGGVLTEDGADDLENAANNMGDPIDGVGNADPYNPGGDLDYAPPPPSEDPFGDAAADFNMSYLEGGMDDTAAEEALAREEVARTLGQGLVDQRARMGRAGFGASGALAGMEADAMRAAQLDVANRISGVREREQQQAYERGLGVQEMDISQQEAANREAMLQAQLDYLKATLGGGDAGTPGQEGGPSYQGLSDDEFNALKNSAGGVFAYADAPPEGAVYVGSHGGYDYYEHPSGDVSRVQQGG